MPQNAIQNVVVSALEDAKGQEIIVLDVRKLTPITDYMAIATGTSDRHVRAMAKKTVQALVEHGVKPSGVEGEQGGEWILIDAGVIVVHIMDRKSREFYELEKLWSADVETAVRELRKG